MEFSVGGSSYYFSQEDLYLSNILYKGELINWDSIKLSESYADRNWGSFNVSSQDFVFDDRSNFWKTLVASYEIRGLDWTIKKYDSYTGVSSTLAIGRIVGYSLGLETSIQVEFFHEEVLDTLIPPKFTNTTDWPGCYTEDLGKPVNIIFGQAKNVPLAHTFNDGSTTFDYLIGYGPITSVDAVYRNNVLVNASEYTLYHSGAFSYLRFALEQMDFSGQFYDLTADITGLLSGSRNAATIIQNILTNTTWGLSESINSTSFTQAAADIVTISTVSPVGFFCDGFISDQKEAKTVLEEICKMFRGYLRRDSAGTWSLTIDTYDSTVGGSLGWGDGYYDNILDDTIEISVPSLSDSMKSYKLRYGIKRTKKNVDLLHFDNTRSVYSYGKDVVEETHWIRNHNTADKHVAYMRQKALYANKFMTVTADLDTDIQIGKIVSVYIPAYGISDGRYKIVEKETYLDHLVYGMESYSSSIYTYTSGSVASDTAGPSPVELTPGVQTYYQTSEPTSGLNVGDLWYDTDSADRTVYRYNGATWDAYTNFSISTYYQTSAPVSGLKTGDLWYDTDSPGKLVYRYNGATWDQYSSFGATTYRQNDAPTVDLKAGDLWYDLDSPGKIVYRYNGTTWDQYSSFGTTTYRQTTAPTVDLKAGDLWYDTDSPGKIVYRYNGTSWDQYSTFGVTTYRQTSAPSSDLKEGDLWYDTDSPGKIIYRYTGSAWEQYSTFGVTTYRQNSQPTTDLKSGDLWYDLDSLEKLIYRYTGSSWEVFSTFGSTAGATLYDEDGETPLSGDSIVTRRFSTADSPNPRIVISGTQIAGYSNATVKEFYIQASTGKAYFGGGAGILDSNGISIVGSGMLRFVEGGVPYGSIYYDGHTMRFRAYDAAIYPVYDFGRWVGSFNDATSVLYAQITWPTSIFYTNIDVSSNNVSVYDLEVYNEHIMRAASAVVRTNTATSTLLLQSATNLTSGAAVEMIGRDAGTNPGRLVLQFGGYDSIGSLLFRHRTSSANVTVGSIDRSGNLAMIGDVSGPTVTASGLISGGSLSSGSTLSIGSLFSISSALAANGSGNITLGGVSFPSGSNSISVRAGTAPGSITGGAVMYSKAYGSDYGMCFRTEDGVLINLYYQTALSAAETTFASISVPAHTNDFAFSAGSSGLGNTNEVMSLCAIVKNMVLRVSQLETRLVNLGIIPSSV